jgi:hypothetical protein
MSCILNNKNKEAVFHILSDLLLITIPIEEKKKNKKKSNKIHYELHEFVYLDEDS